MSFVNWRRVLFFSAGVGKGGGLDGAAEACLSLGIPFIVVVRPHTLVAKGAVKVGVFVPGCCGVVGLSQG